ncbi:hypothetical protein GPJ56_009375 [Histomonas meleagridis]|uniref:uncharacterized protein n=1 Tax=Histomonas meleagridis TaxID=135588 RepID=UPI00355A954F|nr:hypothetical protein GPJ56_009375 [Histomonas meleagridis]KAH0797327.1 hypothetical protein GO595_010009 [Histomonas meleagridis]
MSKFFGNDLNQLSGYKAIYIDWRDVNKTTQESQEDILNLKVPQYYGDITSRIRKYGEYDFKSIDIFRKTYFALSYFLYETDYRWLHRGADDNAINVKHIESYYESLEMKYDPLTEPVILGSCVKRPSTKGFLQGGAGYLYSRKAVELMLPLYEDVIFHCKVAEDVCHNEFLHRLNISIVEATSFNFLGHSFGDEDLRRIYNGDFTNLPACPEEKYPQDIELCGSFHGPLDRVYFLHQHYGMDVDKLIERSQKTFAVNDNTVHYYFPDLRFPKLCRATKDSKIKWL